MNLIRADLHVHTLLSPDSANPPLRILSACIRRGINRVAITDHNRLKGSLEMRDMAPEAVIVGEEIKTPVGEIIGLFLNEEIPRGLSPEETAGRIREQGGLVMIPHPFDRLRSSRLEESALERLVAASLIDIVEVFNSRTTFLSDSRRAWRFAEQHGLLMGGGSDAHTLDEIGQTYVEMPPFRDQKEFLLSLAQGRVVGRRSLPSVHVRSTLVKWRRKYFGGQGSGVGGRVPPEKE